MVINFPDVNELKENVPVCSQNHITHFFAFQVPPIKISPGGEKKLWYLVPREKDDCNFTLPFRLWKNNDKSNYIELPVEFGYSNEDFRGIETSMIYGYVKDENKQVVNLPKLSYSITPGQHKIIEYLLNKKVESMAEFSEKVDVSKAMLYKHIKELKDMDIIEETSEGFKLTDYGRIVVL